MTSDLEVVVVGSGRLGRWTTRMLADRGHKLTIIERNPKRVEQAMDAYHGTVIEGDAARPSVLEQAGLHRADVVAALTDTPGTNLAVCLAAKRLAPEVTTVLRAIGENTEEYDEFVDVALFPERFGARAMVNQIEGGVQSYEQVPGDLDLVSVEVAGDAPVAGRELAAVSLPRGALVVSDGDGDRIAGPDTALTPGETYLVAMEPAVAAEVRQLFRG